MRRLAFLLLALLGLAPALASTVVSDQPDDVSVTIYRDPGRGRGAMDERWPGGYALISEKRRIQIPAGESVIRFEGVAEGMMPETAIVTGLPEGVQEKNRDARLISPAGLVDAYLRRSVHLRRTSRATGKVTEQDAVIRAGPGGGVVIQTAEGFEALGCSGLPERMLYDGLPDGLSAKPTLSVLTTSASAVDVTVELSYLAQGFDWSANYIANMAADGRKADVFAWLTIANGGTQSFADARLQVVAGQPNKEAAANPPEEQMGGLELQCWPMDNTSTHPSWTVGQIADRLKALQELCTYDCDSIVVTGSRIMRADYMANSPIATVSAAMMASQEELGDLKLYRVPEPVTVAAQAQKQVAMINQPGVSFDRIYAGRVTDWHYNTDSEERDAPMPLVLTLDSPNLKAKGLGLPLPAGEISLFEPVGDEVLFVAFNHVADNAVGERFEIGVNESPDVQWTMKRMRQDGRRQYWRIEISNAKAAPIQARIHLPGKPDDKPRGLVFEDGTWVLKARVPANGRTVFNYRVTRTEDVAD